MALAIGIRLGLAARGESPAAFDHRRIPPWAALGAVHDGSNTPGILPLLALRRERLGGLDATRGFHHGLLPEEPLDEFTLMAGVLVQDDDENDDLDDDDVDGGSSGEDEDEEDDGDYYPPGWSD